MPPQLPLPIIYPITSGVTTPQTTPDDPEFTNILRLVRAAVDAEVPLFQIREKTLADGILRELTSRAVEMTRGSKTRLLVNGRPDIASDAGADGAHVTIWSAVPWHRFGTKAPTSRRTPRRRTGNNDDLLIGVSTHSLEEAQAASRLGADFVVFGPVFETESKRAYGPPQGLSKLRDVALMVDKIPVVAIGGITLDNVADCFNARASGVAAIRLLNDVEKMSDIAQEIRRRFNER